MARQNNKKKIVFVGPPGSGKTTVKEVYFEMANPIKLLEESLPPTKGFNSNIYSFFDSNFGLFDVGGQENQQWFSKEKNIFNESSVIICIFEITNSLESIIPFLINLIRVKKELNLRDCNVIDFLHKIDLINLAYANLKTNSIKNFLDVQYVKGKDIKIYETSIAKEYFFQTYTKVLEVLNLVYEKKLISLDKTEFENLKTELSFLLKSNSSKKNNIQDLQTTFDVKPQDIHFHLNRLEKLGFARVSVNNPNCFQLTERVYLFKLGLEKESEKIEENIIEKGIDLCYKVFNLNKTSVKA